MSTHNFVPPFQMNLPESDSMEMEIENLNYFQTKRPAIGRMFDDEKSLFSKKTKTEKEDPQKMELIRLKKTIEKLTQYALENENRINEITDRMEQMIYGFTEMFDRLSLENHNLKIQFENNRTECPSYIN